MNTDKAMIEDDGFMTIHPEIPDLPCPVCHGVGTVPCAGTYQGLDFDTVEDCPTCSEPLMVNGVWRRQF